MGRRRRAEMTCWDLTRKSDTKFLSVAWPSAGKTSLCVLVSRTRTTSRSSTCWPGYACTTYEYCWCEPNATPYHGKIRDRLYSIVALDYPG